tara:strand:- start:1987 stop:2403 length:417 start_codon:yes stop_codon:yes gene_type:complete
MAKQTGLGDYFAVDDSGGTARDISNDVTSVTFNQGQALSDITGLDKSALERLALLGDLTVSVSGVYNAASNKSHDVFKTLSTARTMTYAVGGNTSTNPELEAEMLIGAYNLARAADGSLTWTADLSLQSGTVPTWGTV